MTATFDSHYQLALRAAGAGDFERAVELYDKAIALDSSRAEAFYKRGNALKNLGKLEAAVESYNKAIERRCDYAYAYCNRGAAQQALDLPLDALASYDRAIAIDPADAMSHYNRALLMQDLFRWDEALVGYQSAVAIDPHFADAHFNRAVTQLYCGDFKNGWRNYEWRWKNAQRLGIGEERQFDKPLWLGEDAIAGKRLLLHSEGGLGDSLQFCRYAPLAAALGATVYLEVQRPLKSMLAKLEGISLAVARDDWLPEFDFHCPLMSLPLAFKTTLETIPAMPNYLRNDKAVVARWQLLLEDSKRPRVGLVWSGNPKNLIDRRRSIHISDWIPYLPREFDYFCLQKDVRQEDEATLALDPFIRRFDLEVDMVSNAALCECMDVVISVDTSVAHLSGALGRPTWILLPYVPDWRWLRDRSDCPWYPSATLYRQGTPGDWCGIFVRVAADLRRHLSIKPSLSQPLLD